MNQEHLVERVLALDVRPRSFGYVVFERRDRILDFGIRHYSRQGFSADQMQLRLAEIIGQWEPDTVVLQNRKIHLFAAKLRSRIAAIQQEVLARNITLRLLDPASVKDLFRSLECKNKQAVAMYLAGRYPEIAWKLPAARQLWESEDPRASIFDAAANAFTYFSEDPS